MTRRHNPDQPHSGTTGRTTRWALLAADIAGAAGLLIGIPALLLWWVGWPPWPATVPSLADVDGWISALPSVAADAQDLFARLIACLLWCGWSAMAWKALRITLTAAKRLGHRLARRPRTSGPRLLPGGPTHIIAGGMVGAVAVGLATGTTALASDTAPQTATPTPDSSTPPPPTAVPSNPATTARPTSAVGLSLPDGSWLDGHLADDVSAAAAAAWVHRRRIYRPRPITTATRTDVAPLAPPIAALLRANATAPDDEPSECRDTALSPVVTPPAGLQSWIGLGAESALRAAIAAALLNPVGGTVWCTTTVWQRLFAIASGDGLNRLHLAADSAALLDSLQHHLLDRIPHTETPARALVVTDPPPHSDLPQWRFAAAVAAHLGTATIACGDLPDTPTWHIDTDGTTPRGRVSILTPPTGRATIELASGQMTTFEVRSTAVDHSAATEQPSKAARDTTTRPALWLRVLGEPVLYNRRTGMTEIPIQRRAAVETLTALAVHKHGLTTTELASTLWPDVRPHSAYRRLQTTLSSLRTALRPIAADVVSRSGDRYRLNPAHIDTDLWTFEDLRTRAATAPDAEQRLTALRALTDLYADELAAGTDWPWLTPHREAARRTTIDAYIDLAETSADQHTTADLLRQMLTIDPLNEDVHRRLIHHHAAAGDLDAVANAYRHLTERLAAHNLTPDDETVRLAERLLGTTTSITVPSRERRRP